MWTGLEPAALPRDAVEVGYIAGAWGVRGWFKIVAYSAQPEALFSSKSWFLTPPERGARHFDGVQQIAIREARDHAGGVVANAQGIGDRSAAESLRGARIWIARTSFPTPEPDQYYWVDLIGLMAINCQGQTLGTVSDLLATGAQTTLVLDDAVDGKPVQRMIPFVSVYVLEVDIPGHCIRVDWQADY